MSEIGVHEAKTHFSDLLRRVVGGEEIVITRSGEAVAKLVPIRGGRSRRFGQDAGAVEIADDFDAPLPDELQARFE